MHKVKKN